MGDGINVNLKTMLCYVLGGTERAGHIGKELA